MEQSCLLYTYANQLLYKIYFIMQSDTKMNSINKDFIMLHFSLNLNGINMRLI